MVDRVCVIYDWFYDARPPKPAFFLNERFVAARHKEGCYKKNASVHFLVCKGLSNGDIGVTRGAVIKDIRPGAGVNTGDFVEEKLRELP